MWFARRNVLLGILFYRRIENVYFIKKKKKKDKKMYYHEYVRKRMKKDMNNVR